MSAPPANPRTAGVPRRRASQSATSGRAGATSSRVERASPHAIPERVLQDQMERVFPSVCRAKKNPASISRVTRA